MCVEDVKQTMGEVKIGQLTGKEGNTFAEFE
jgi:hypothetical protein